MLITSSEIIQLVLPNKNLDNALLDDSIPVAELKYIRKIIGKELYNQLIVQQAAQQFTGLNETLLNTYLKPCLARYVVYEAMPLIKAEITSNGLQTPAIEYNLPVSAADFAMLRNKMFSDAELMLHEMLDYISEYSSSFPTYTCDNNISGTSLPYLY
jgi:hypothetical protein